MCVINFLIDKKSSEHEITLYKARIEESHENLIQTYSNFFQITDSEDNGDLDKYMDNYEYAIDKLS